MKLSKQYRLMSAIGFSEDDLNANRKDALSKRQANQLRRHARRWLDFAFFSFLAGLFVLMIASGTGKTSEESLRNVLIVIVITLVIVGLAWLMHGSEILSIEKQSVDVIEGFVHPRTFYVSRGKYGRERVYQLEITGIKFWVNRSVFKAFGNGGVYRIYYAPVTKTILAVESASDPPRKQKIRPIEPTDPVLDAIQNPARPRQR